MGFDALGLNPQLRRAVTNLGYTVPTEIQQKAIPVALAGQDVLGIAQTGTGKTAAYLLPMLRKLNFAQGQDIRALILAPTRELADQITRHAQALAAETDLRIYCAMGGVGMKAQLEAIAGGLDVLVTTPGRFWDLYKSETLILKYLKIFVLDEADKMMDMGFMPQLRRMLEVLPVKRQNLLFSATFPAKVEELSAEFLEWPVRIEITPQSTPVESVQQILYEVSNTNTKYRVLEWLFKEEVEQGSMLVFCRTRQTVNHVADFLQARGIDDFRVIHANKDQNTRMNAMKAFETGEVSLLISTDVTSRGMDISRVGVVVNFDVPLIYEDYVHRIGRTGRAGRSGKSFTFADPAELWHIQKIERIIRMPIPRKLFPGFLEEETSKEEAQRIAREMDEQKRKDDPAFKGAFHEKQIPKKFKKRR